MNKLIGINLIISAYWLLKCSSEFGDIGKLGHKINRLDIIEGWAILTIITIMVTSGIFLLSR